MLEFSVNAIGKHRVKKRTHLKGRFCFHILKNLAQNNNYIEKRRSFDNYVTVKNSKKYEKINLDLRFSGPVSMLIQLKVY